MPSSGKSSSTIDLMLAVVVLAICGVVLHGSGSIRDLPYEPLGASFFPIVISLILGVMAFILLFKSMVEILKVKQETIIDENLKIDEVHSQFRKRPLLAFITVGFTLVYIALLSSKLVGFRLGTILFVAAVGTVISRFNPRKSFISLMLGLALGVGLYYIFTKIFIVDLP